MQVLLTFGLDQVVSVIKPSLASVVRTTKPQVFVFKFLSGCKLMERSLYIL